MTDQNAAVEAGAWWAGEGERAADAAASRWVVQQVTAAADKDMAAYFTGNQDRRNASIYLDDRVPIESREICFPPGKLISRELTSLIVTLVLSCTVSELEHVLCATYPTPIQP